MAIVWSSTMDNVPDIYCKGIPEQDDEYEDDEDEKAEKADEEE